MTSVSTAGSTENNNAAAGAWTECLGNKDEEAEVMAAAAAIPSHLRREVLAHLQSLICVNATHTVAVCK
jgi:hypothetical protein